MSTPGSSPSATPRRARHASDPPAADATSTGGPSRRLYAGASLEAGTFEIAPRDPDFAHAGAIGQWPEVVFPRLAVEIAPSGRRSFVADANLAVLYNAGQEYRRRQVSAAGDRCNWLAIRPEVLREIANELGALPEAADGPFRDRSTPCDDTTYALQELLFDELQGEVAEALWLEETVLFVLGRLFGVPAKSSGEVSDRQRDIVEHTKAVIAAHLDTPLLLDDLSAAVGVSTFHLCRTFRHVTGATIAGYHRRLRLRLALQWVGEARGDLTRIALDLGFSSHSHFTNAFRRLFGFPPREVWARGGRALISRLAEDDRRPV